MEFKALNFFNVLPEVKLCVRRHLGQGFKNVTSVPTILTDSDKGDLPHPPFPGGGSDPGRGL